jgi:hypothetical protein
MAVLTNWGEPRRSSKLKEGAIFVEAGELVIIAYC